MKKVEVKTKGRQIIHFSLRDVISDNKLNNKISITASLDSRPLFITIFTQVFKKP